MIGHGGEVALADLLADETAAGADVLTKITRQFQEREGPGS